MEAPMANGQRNMYAYNTLLAHSSLAASCHNTVFRPFKSTISRIHCRMSKRNHADFNCTELAESAATIKALGTDNRPLTQTDIQKLTVNEAYKAHLASVQD
jgi:hypothetical protein